jgi:hypothetical protein
LINTNMWNVEDGQFNKNNDFSALPC